eukprot:1248458-Amphidinium_carterae.1
MTPGASPGYTAARMGLSCAARLAQEVVASTTPGLAATAMCILIIRSTDCKAMHERGCKPAA